MQDGHFLYTFFSERQALNPPNYHGEIAVRCPFEHASGFDKNASATINPDPKKGLFHCFTCEAEGRFHNGGLNELQFIQEYFHLSVKEALRMKLELLESLNEDVTPDTWSNTNQEMLWKSPPTLQVLYDRGLTDETIREYRLGYSGSGIEYPVFFMGLLYDVRTYDPEGHKDLKNMPKMRSKKGATTAMFPFDEWRTDQRPTLLVGGENDALVGRQLGFNCVTFTGGEGSVPSAVFLREFKGRTVYVMYDADATGLKASQTVAFHLKEAGAVPYIVDIRNAGLTGEKHDKDLSDLYLKHGKGAKEVQELIDSAAIFTEVEHRKVKDRVYKLINIWESARYVGKHVSSRIIITGKYNGKDMLVPSWIEYKCECGDEDCPLLRAKDNSYVWKLDTDTLKSVPYLIEVSEKEQISAIYNKILPFHFTKRCKPWYTVRSWDKVQKVILAPDLETDDVDDGRGSNMHYSDEQHAFIITPNHESVTDTERYRIYYKPFPHPKTQEVIFVVDRFEESDNSMNTFKITPRVHESLKLFQGPAAEMMEKRFQMAKTILGNFSTDMLVWTTDLAYHSPLEFNLQGVRQRGYPSVAIVGESRTGKTSTTINLQKFYKFGNRIVLKMASAAGLIGGAEQMSNGSFRIKWGAYPRNDRGLLILDEVSGASPETISQLTDMRSEEIATLSKIVAANVPARTRNIWVGNPRIKEGRITKTMKDYSSGVDVVRDLIGRDEDINRFDAILLVQDTEEYISSAQFMASGLPHYDRDIYVNLIRWVWSRKKDQVIFAEGVEDYIFNRSQALNTKYYTRGNLKIFGTETMQKLARIAVACAACCYSSDETGENLIVKEEHVNWAENYYYRCYDDELFRLEDFSKETRKYSEMTPEVATIVSGIMQNEQGARLMEALYNTNEALTIFHINSLLTNQLQRDNQISYMLKHRLIRIDKNGFAPTTRLKEGFRQYRSPKRLERV